MAVFTQVSTAQVADLLHQYGIDQLLRLDGIEGGAENSNYFVTTPTQQLVLTIFEQLSAQDLDWYLGLYRRLYGAQLPVPELWVDQAGQALQQIANRPAALMSRLPGRHIEWVRPVHAQQVGVFLGQLHQRAPLMRKRQPAYSHQWCQAQQWANDHPLFAPALAISEHLHQLNLPQGLLHADLFRDNLLFTDDRLTGVLDWFFACHDRYVIDIAIALEDWCADDEQLSTHLLIGYQTERALSDDELAALPLARVHGLLGFWLKRRHNEQLCRQGLRSSAKPSLELTERLGKRIEQANIAQRHLKMLTISKNQQS